MGFTYRQGHDGRLSIAEMDNNFLYAEEQIGSLTASVVSLNTNVAAATASIATLNTNVAAATASIATLNTNVAGLTASVIDLQNAFSNITGSFNFLLLVGGVTQSGTFSFTNGILGTYSI